MWTVGQWISIYLSMEMDVVTLYESQSPTEFLGTPAFGALRRWLFLSFWLFSHLLADSVVLLPLRSYASTLSVNAKFLPVSDTDGSPVYETG